MTTYWGLGGVLQRILDLNSGQIQATGALPMGKEPSVRVRWKAG